MAGKKEFQNRIARAIEQLKEVGNEISEFKEMLHNRFESIEDILMGESH